jgi:hypothetical protein
MTELDSTSETSPARERLLLVSVSQLRAAPHAPASAPVSSALVESLRTYGVLQPLIVRPAGDGYEVVAGHKRWMAAREAGLTEVPVRVYRVEDAALEGLYSASNLLGERRRISPSPGTNSFKPGARLSGLLEEELNRPPPEVPYRQILSVAAVLLIVLWGGLELFRGWTKNSGTEPRPTPTARAIETPRPGAQPTPSASNRSSLETWRGVFAGIDGVEVRIVAEAPRIVFQAPVFSRLTTIDPAQESRLARVAQRLREYSPNVRLAIIGHTDNDAVRPGGSYSSNEQLGQQRAEAVARFLNSNQHFPENRMSTLSVGSIDPPFSNDTPEGKVRNRTVTLEILQPRT